MSSQCGAFCSFCGRCGRTVSKSFRAPKVVDVAPPGVAASRYRAEPTTDADVQHDSMDTLAPRDQ